jgi:quercetin dioxygenase-like cupin family protein
MQILRNGSLPSMQGPENWFTGRVRIDGLYQPDAPARVSAGTVTFEPTARTAWHSHPLGQMLIVVAGCGRIQRDGDLITEIRAGDMVWIEPGEKHWHGAAPLTAMSHIAIQEYLDGEAADWLEQVSDAQYAGATTQE